MSRKLSAQIDALTKRVDEKSEIINSALVAVYESGSKTLKEALRPHLVALGLIEDEEIGESEEA